jgi:hypothetical protein
MQPKKCLLCGCLDEGGNVPTCPCCGEATWMPVRLSAKPDLETTTIELSEELGESLGEPPADAPPTDAPPADVTPKKKRGRK